ncbi:MAG: SWIM zinc finger family protein [Candidatus Gastranaerophilales bacterium]|nr:SWIM zinc finger family protein [Candidatus Gastranaerophilales bacterium]
MDLGDFENYFEEKILKRGKKYFEDENILSCKNIDNTWTAKVEGTETYNVTIKFKNDTIQNAYCNCPYSDYDFCKHIAAVLYFIRNSENLTTQTSSTDENDLSQLLEKADKQELIKILSDYAQNDEDIEKNIKFCLSQNKDSVAYVKEIIQNSIKQAKGRHGFIDYDKMPLAVLGVNKALKIAEQESKNANLETATDICLIVIDRINKIIYNCDDSNGEISFCLGETLDLLEQIASRPNDKIFDKIFKVISSKNDLYDDVFFDLLDIDSRLCSSQETKNKIKNLITQKIEQNKDQKFALQKYQELFYNFLNTYESDEAAQAYLYENIDNYNFRSKIINKLIKEQKFDEALNLCLHGEKEHKDFAGVILDFKKLRYAIYELQNDVENKKQLALDLLKHHEFAYYSKLKKLYSKAEWTDELKIVLTELKNKQDVYVKIIIAEGLKKLLFEYCEKFPFYVFHYYEKLLPDYKTELIPLFVDCIKKDCTHPRERKFYKEICKKIKKFQTACGDIACKSLVNELSNTYKNRKALLEELSKIK